MERRLLRKRVSDDGEDVDLVEVDRISFTSFASSDDDDDLRMSVQQSPVFSNYSDFKSASELSLHCRHRSISDNDIASHATLGAQINEPPESPAPTTTTDSAGPEITELETASEPIAERPSRNSVFNCDWVDSLYLAAPASVPELLGEPYWKTLEKELAVQRQLDAATSKDLEESNIYMYSMQLSMCAMEEARWYNEMSKDPELSKLINEIDPKFPLAVNCLPCNNEVCEPSTSDGSSLDMEQPSVATTTPHNIGDQVPVFIGRKRAVRSSRTYGGNPPKKFDPTWSELAGIALESFIETEQIRDPRISDWMEELIHRTDTLMALPSTSQDDKVEAGDANTTSSSGSSEWMPLHDDWIFTLWKSDSIRMFCSVNVLLKEQNNRCAGCGIRIEKEYLKRVKYCEYYGKIFCQCCHQGSKFIIPARILHTWNFNEFPVSDIAFHFLNEIRDVPAINVCSVAPQIVEKIRVLKHVIVLREKLSYMWDYVKECADAEEAVTKCGNLKTLFTSLEQHLLHSLDLFSLSDLVRVHNKDMSTLLEPIVYYGKCHIEACERCKQYGATCVYCEKTDELLFPFQMEKVYKCSTCGSLSHLKCQAKFRRKTSADNGCSRCHQPNKINSSV